MRAFLTSLVVAFVVLSAVADRGSRPVYRDLTATVNEFEAGQWITVANEQSDPMGLRVQLSGTTIYESRDQVAALDPAAIRPGVRVRIWYARDPGRARLVADKVRVLTDAIPR